jgi:hypothetical protein
MALMMMIGQRIYAASKVGIMRATSDKPDYVMVKRLRGVIF